MKTNFTKTIILSSIITIGLFSTVKAQTAYNDQYYNNQYNNGYNQSCDQQQSFYYYPSANVYYNPFANNYSYNNGRGWLTVNVLPAGISVYNAPRYTVYHRGPQVWLDNPVHIKNYRQASYYKPVVVNNHRDRDFRRMQRNRW
ncbi:hypothetical protein [Ferruginibacter albus]|uniref:hypothetical protein n=1 Tax=Ferruginibacter albus TaxID=2875540 RepID=UPI001CC4E188|nr:hypothetical protein [Ferruginibacter albus]UAY51451.1 hypothetical protein K9M53_12740 [Ferruginibacter albus]